MSGNSFASTSCQAKLISCLCHSASMRTTPQDQDTTATTKQSSPEAIEDIESMPPLKRHRTKSAAPTHFTVNLAHEPHKQKVAENVPSSSLVEKIAMMSQVQERKRGRGRPKGSTSQTKSTTGHTGGSLKTNVPKIATKFIIVQEYLDMVERGIAHPEKRLLESGKYRNILYRGALSESKWLSACRKHNWKGFVAKFPKMAERVAEVPNAVRKQLSIDVAWQLWIVLCFVIIYLYIYIY